MILEYKEFKALCLNEATKKDGLVLHFHKGSEDKHYNAGHITFKKVETLSEYVAKSDRFFTDEDGMLKDGNGNPLGVHSDDTVGVIDLDGDYDTEIFIYLDEIDYEDRYYDSIIKSDRYIDLDVRAYIAKAIWEENEQSLNSIVIESTDDDGDIDEEIFDEMTKAFFDDLSITSIDIKDAIKKKIRQKIEQ